MITYDQDFYLQRTFTLPKTSKITEETVQQLDHLLEFASADDYRNALIEIYLIYICREHDSLPINFNKIADQIYFLVEFLKTASKEMNQAVSSPINCTCKLRAHQPVNQ